MTWRIDQQRALVLGVEQVLQLVDALDRLLEAGPHLAAFVQAERVFGIPVGELDLRAGLDRERFAEIRRHLACVLSSECVD
jgi:hypothetical protein